MVISHPSRFRRCDEVFDAVYESLQRFAGEISLAEAIGTLDLVKMQIVQEALDGIEE